MSSRFHYTRDFLLASLAAFAVTGATLLYFEQRQAQHLQEVLDSGARRARQMQESLVDRVAEEARRDLIAVNEQANLNLGRAFVNTLWPAALAPFLAQAGQLALQLCGQRGPYPDAQELACMRAHGERLRALPGFRPLDQRVRAAIEHSTVFRVKLFDLTGTLVYATQAADIGQESKASPGWQSAVIEGRPRSELSYRDTYSNLHGEAARRDLIATYLPVADPATGQIVGAFEIYADVTPFLRTLESSAAGLRQTARDNEQQLANDARANLDQVQRMARERNLMLVGLLALLYLVLLFIVRHAHQRIERQAAENEAGRQRMLQVEKMTVLGQMVAGVAHQLNTPLAFSRNNVQLTQQALGQLVREVEPLVGEPGRPGLAGAVDDIAEATIMLDDVVMGMDQMSELVDHLRSFSRIDRATTADVDLNSTLATVCYIARTVIAPRIEVIEQLLPLPPCNCNVSQLNHVFLNLLMNAAQAIEGHGTVTVSSAFTGGRICVSVRDTGSGIPPEIRPRIFEPYFTTKASGKGTGLGLSIARDIVEQHGGFIEAESPRDGGAEFRVWLPASQEKSP